MPAFLSVLCISMNPSNRCYCPLNLIVVARIGPVSLLSVTSMYLFSFADVISNSSVWSLDDMPLRPLHLTAVTCIMCSRRFLICISGKYLVS